MLIKTIDSDNLIFYYSIDEIPANDLEYIWYLSCHNENINNIDFITNIPNLKELDASSNNITTMPIHDSLEIIDISYNQIDILPTLASAIDINASFNKIKLLYGLPKIKKLNISNNLLNNILLENSLIELNCSNNMINKIIFNNKHNNLEKLDCSYNRLNNINFVFLLDFLTDVIYNNNMITYVAPHIKRLLSKDEYYKKSRHSMTLNEQLKIHYILLKPPIDYAIVKNEISNCPVLTDNAKEQMLYYSEFDEPNYKIPVTYKELLCSVWAIIKYNCNQSYQYILNLNYIYIAPHICKCRSCQLINLSKFMDINERYGYQAYNSIQVVY